MIPIRTPANSNHAPLADLSVQAAMVRRLRREYLEKDEAAVSSRRDPADDHTPSAASQRSRRT